MGFQDLRELLDDVTLKLPIAGVEYVIEPCTAEDWLWFNARNNDLDQKIKTGEMDAEAEGTDPEEMYRRCLGGAFDDMVADGVRGAELQVSSWTAFFWHLGNADFAEQVWINGGKALTAGSESLKTAIAAPNRASRRAAVKKTSPRSAAPSTRRATAASGKGRTPKAS